jgi:hypothetical protein
MRSVALFCVLACAVFAARVHAQDCAGGRVASPATDWHCCWPAQRWGAAERACIGPPSCPAGTVAHGEDCVGTAQVTPQYAPRAPVGPAPLAPIAPRAPYSAPIGAPVAQLVAPPIGATIAVDVRSVPMGAPEWLSSPNAPTADVNPRHETFPLNLDLLVPGIVFLGTGYLTAVITAFLPLSGATDTLDGQYVNRGDTSARVDATCHDVVGALQLVPVIGALLALVAMSCTSADVDEVLDSSFRVVGYRLTGDSHPFPSSGYAAILIPSAAFQILGLGLLLGGISQEHQSFVVDEHAGVHLEIVAGAQSADAGLSLRGTF